MANQAIFETRAQVYLGAARRFRNENDKEKVFPKKLLKLCDLNAEDVKLEGNYGYIKRGKKWVDFVEFCSLSTAENARSTDDPDYDVMIVDEFAATPGKINRYVGDEVRDFLDLFVSKKRDHHLTAFLLGNRETFYNPYYTYFDLPQDGPDGTFMFRGGSVSVTRRSKPPDGVTNDLHDLLAGTDYGEYLFDGVPKTQKHHEIGEKPKSAKHYASFDFGVPFTIWRAGGKLYVRAKVDAGRVVFVSDPLAAYRKKIVCGKRDRARFSTLERLYKRGKILYSNESVASACEIVLLRLGIIQ